MGHEIRHASYPYTMDKKRIVDYCNDEAEFNSDTRSGLYNGIRFHDLKLADYNDACKWINDHDEGFYDNLAVSHYYKGKLEWLVKYEYHV